MSLRILRLELHDKKAAAQHAGIVIGPPFARRAIAVALDYNPHKLRSFAWIVPAVDDGLSSETIGLIVEPALLTVEYGNAMVNIQPVLCPGCCIHVLVANLEILIDNC